MGQIHHIEAPLAEGRRERAGRADHRRSGRDGHHRADAVHAGRVSEATTTAAAPRVPAPDTCRGRIIQVQHIPATLTGKKMEVPVNEPPGREAGRG